MKAIAIDRRLLRVAAALLLGILVSLLGGVQCAAAAAAGVSTCEARALAAHELVPGGTLDNWEPLSDRAVLIWAKHSARAYLVSLDRKLAGLAAASVIDLVDGDHDHSLSPCGHDGVAIGDGAGDGTIAHIVSIERLSLRRTAELDPGAQPMGPRSLRV